MGQHRYQYDYQTDQGSAFVAVPITITLGVNDNIPFTEQNSGAALAVIVPGIYATGAALAQAVQDAIQAVQGDPRIFSCTFSGHKLTIFRTVLTFTLDWASRPTHSAAAALGWNATDVPATLSSTAQNAITL